MKYLSKRTPRVLSLLISPLALVAAGGACLIASADRLQGLPGAFAGLGVLWLALAGGAALTAVEKAGGQR